jgi:hypothetical protein
MAMSSKEIRDWLDTLDHEAQVAIDEGGLMLVVIGDDSAYLEVGGVPREEEDQQRRRSETVRSASAPGAGAEFLIRAVGAGSRQVAGVKFDSAIPPARNRIPMVFPGPKSTILKRGFMAREKRDRSVRTTHGKIS